MDDSIDFVLNENRPIHINLKCTVNELMAMVYSFHVRHNLTMVALEDLAELFNRVLEKKVLPVSKRTFIKKFNSNQESSQVVHFVCNNCNKYLGKQEDFRNSKSVLCSNCEKVVNITTKYDNNFFLTFPVENQLLNILDICIKNEHMMSTRDAESDGMIDDVHSSELLKKLNEQIVGLNREYITLTLSTDGACVFKSSKNKSLWPLQFFVNEIKKEHRFKRQNIMLAAISCSKTPDMSTFMRVFIEEINSINNKGGLQLQINGGIRKLLVIPTNLTTDSIAKCYVASKTQHNSHFGCPYCLHPGTILENSTQIKYCTEHNAMNRTHASTKANMIEASNIGKPVQGYKGISPMLALKTPFDITWQISIDKMHSIDLGVVKKHINLFLDKQNRNKR